MKKRYNLAELRCYEKNNMGIEVSECLSYVFVEKIGYLDEEKYQNVFKDESLPIVKNVRLGGNNNYFFESYNYNNLDDYSDVGLCWTLTDISIDNLPISDLKNIVIYSDHYFMDRKDLIEEKYEYEIDRNMRRTIFNDLMRYDEICNYLDDRGIDINTKKNKYIR